MTITKIRQLRQALLDNAAGGQLHQVHRNELFTLLDEAEAFNSWQATVIESVKALGEPTDGGAIDGKFGLTTPEVSK